jgi:hypothetical protein
MTDAIYEEVSAQTEKATVQHRRISVCGILKYLDVSRSACRFCLHTKPSRQEQRRKAVKLRINLVHGYNLYLDI